MDKIPVIFHVDVNSAFLSWSAVDMLKKNKDVDIRKVPSVIGGDENSRRGVVLAKSNPAKAYGIVTGESLFSARKKCPNILIIPPIFSVYRDYSHNMMNFLKEYTPYLEQYSIDECFLDMGVHTKEDAFKLAETMKNSIKSKFGFTVNVGISSNKLLAKMASELKKPDKVNTLYVEEIEKKLWTLPVSELFMVGKKATEKLNKMYIFTIGDLASYDVNILQDKFKSYGKLIWEYARGIDDSKVSSDSYAIKNISNETTLAKDVTNREEAHKILLELSEQVASRLRKENKYCFSIGVNIKNSNFKSYSHQRKLANPTDSTKTIYNTAVGLFDEGWKKDPIRLLGVTLAQLTEQAMQQLTLFDSDFDIKKSEKEKSIDRTIDAIRERYGDKSIKKCASGKVKSKK